MERSVGLLTNKLSVMKASPVAENVVFSEFPVAMDSELLLVRLFSSLHLTVHFIRTFCRRSR